MTWTKSVTLWCDGDDCYNWVRTGDPTVETTRKNTEWTHRDGKDYCPDCASETFDAHAE